MTTLPGITTFSDAAATSASAVYANDVALAGAFGSLEMSDSISNDNSPIMIGPIRVVIEAPSSTLYIWQAPVDLELWELHVSPVSAVDGTMSGATLDGSNKGQILVRNDGDDVGDGVMPLSLTASETEDLSGESNRVVAAGDEVEIITFNFTNTPKYHACISILAYTKHKE